MKSNPTAQDLVCISDAIANLCESKESIKVNIKLISELQVLLSLYIKSLYR